jgi:hypothetical protein
MLYGTKRGYDHFKNKADQMSRQVLLNNKLKRTYGNG